MALLSKDPHIKEAARTPLIAGLMCSLYQAGTDLPTTELELYEKRFDLLLGKWEQAKRIPPLPKSVRRLYLYFLRTFAMKLHVAQRRVGDRKLAEETAHRFCHAGGELDGHQIVDDCIRRGVLEYEETGSLSLGHLTYQEYLAAEWLHWSGDIQTVADVLMRPWWKKVVEFWAARREDITPLVALLWGFGVGEGVVARLASLTALAKLTPGETVKKINKLGADQSLPTFTWRKTMDPPPTL